MPFFITIRQDGRSVKKEYSRPIRLTDAIANSGFAFESPCGGNGICGNCKVFVQGRISDPSDGERAFLGDSINHGVRLACLAEAYGDAVVDIPKAVFADISEKSIKVTIDPITGDKKCFACAVDIGTTTLVFRYYSLPEGRLIYSDFAQNPQCVRGSDILTRIEYAVNGGAEELEKMIEDAIQQSRKRFGRNIEFYVITGNTAMLHIARGMSVSGIATAPFEPESLFGDWYNDRYYMRCASSFVGADAVASLLISGITEVRNPALLLDIGTNNECILWDGKTLTACSSPAGPAFEGANISCGVSARSGAIYEVFAGKNGIAYNTVDDAKPVGICGSGLIDAVAYFIENRLIDAEGTIINNLPEIGGCSLTGQDIAELQLAKSAVCAGIYTLLDDAGMTVADLSKIVLTGSFGTHLNKTNAARIGLIPNGTESITHTTSFGAIEGASALLLNKSMFDTSSRLADSIRTVELADSKVFEKEFLKNLRF